MPLKLIPQTLLGIIQAETEKRANEKLSAVQRLAQAAGVQAELVWRSNDHPWQAVIDIAKEKHCDLIVLASQLDEACLAGLLLGSQPLRVLTHSSIPVLVVR